MRANQIAGFTWTEGTGSNDLSGNQYHAVKLDAQGAAKIADATDIVIGFQTDNPTGPNQYVALESNGIALASCGAAVAKGAEVTIMADGKVETKNGVNTIVGTALEVGVTGQIISVKLKNI